MGNSGPYMSNIQNIENIFELFSLQETSTLIPHTNSLENEVVFQNILVFWILGRWIRRY